jgi:hypothetical protein
MVVETFKFAPRERLCGISAKEDYRVPYLFRLLEKSFSSE